MPAWTSQEQSYAALLTSFEANLNKNEQKVVHLKPLAFVRLNTRHGKPKPITIKALLDSGAAGSLITKEFCYQTPQKQYSETRMVNSSWSYDHWRNC